MFSVRISSPKCFTKRFPFLFASVNLFSIIKIDHSIMSDNAIIHHHPRHRDELSYLSLSLIFDFFSSSSVPTTSIEKDCHHQYQYQSSSIASILQFGSVCKRWRDAMKNFCSVETWQRLARCYVVRNPFSNNDDADNQHHNDTESILRNIIISECKTYYDFFELGNYFIPMFPRPLSTTEIQHSSLFLKNTPLGDRGDQCPDIKSCRDTYLKTREDARAQQIAPANFVSGERFPALLLSSLQVKCRCCHQMMSNDSSSSSCANPAPPPRLTRNLLRTNMLFEGLPILFDPERLHHPKNNGRIFCIASKKNISTAAQVPGNCCVDLTSTGNDLHHRFHNNNHPQSGIADMVMRGNTFVGSQVYIALVVKDPLNLRSPENGDRGAEIVSHMLTHFFRSRTKKMVPGTRFLTRNHLQYRPEASSAIVNLVVVENDSNNDMNTSNGDDNHHQESSSSAASSLELKSDTLRTTFSTLCNPASPDCPRIEWSFVIVFPGAGKINFDKTSQLKRLRRENRVALPSNLISMSKNTPTPFVTACTGSDEVLINNEAPWIDIDPSYSKNLLYYVMGLVGDWLGVFEVERRNSRLGRKLRVMQGLNDAIIIPKEEHDDSDDEDDSDNDVDTEEEEEEEYDDDDM